MQIVATVAKHILKLITKIGTLHIWAISSFSAHSQGCRITCPTKRQQILHFTQLKIWGYEILNLRAIPEPFFRVMGILPPTNCLAA